MNSKFQVRTYILGIDFGEHSLVPVAEGPQDLGEDPVGCPGRLLALSPRFQICTN